MCVHACVHVNVCVCVCVCVRERGREKGGGRERTDHSFVKIVVIVLKTEDFPFGLISWSVPKGCGGYFKAEMGSLTSPGYPTGHNYTDDTECVWKIETTAYRKVNISFSEVQAHETGTANYIRVCLIFYWYVHVNFYVGTKSENTWNRFSSIHMNVCDRVLSRKLGMWLIKLVLSSTSESVWYFSDLWPRRVAGDVWCLLLSGISGLSFDSPFLSPLFYFLLPSPLALSVLSFFCSFFSWRFSRKLSNMFR